MRISYWRSDVCSSDLLGRGQHGHPGIRQQHVGLRSIRSSLPILMYQRTSQRGEVSMYDQFYGLSGRPFQLTPDPHFYFESATHRKAMSYLGYRSEEHTSELQSLMRISYAVFCLKKKITM